MLKIEKYTGAKVYQSPSGGLMTRERVLAEWEAALTFTHIIETDEAGEVMFACQNLAAIRSMYGIDPALSEDEAIAKIEEIRNTPPPEPEPSAEERIAAAMEYQNLINS